MDMESFHWRLLCSMPLPDHLETAKLIQNARERAKMIIKLYNVVSEPRIDFGEFSARYLVYISLSVSLLGKRSYELWSQHGRATDGHSRNQAACVENTKMRNFLHRCAKQEKEAENEHRVLATEEVRTGSSDQGLFPCKHFSVWMAGVPHTPAEPPAAIIAAISPSAVCFSFPPIYRWTSNPHLFGPLHHRTICLDQMHA